LGIKAAVAHIPRTTLQEAVGQIPSKLQSELTIQPKRAPLTIAITGSDAASPVRARRRLQTIISPYLNSHTIWYCGSFGNADEIAVEYLLQENQQVIVVGSNSLRISDRMRFLLETYRLPFVDAQQEQVPVMPGNTSKRDILFFTKSDLVILIWDGQSKPTCFMLNWLRELLFEVILFVFASAYLFQGIAWKHSGRELTGVCWKMALTHNFSRQHEAVFLKRDLSRLKQNASFSESELGSCPLRILVAKSNRSD
jgi:hypothetical protein